MLRRAATTAKAMMLPSAPAFGVRSGGQGQRRRQVEAAVPVSNRLNEPRLREVLEHAQGPDL
jgi:hypothetical protein